MIVPHGSCKEFNTVHPPQSSFFFRVWGLFIFKRYALRTRDPFRARSQVTGLAVCVLFKHSWRGESDRRGGETSGASDGRRRATAAVAIERWRHST